MTDTLTTVRQQLAIRYVFLVIPIILTPYNEMISQLVEYHAYINHFVVNMTGHHQSSRLLPGIEKMSILIGVTTFSFFPSILLILIMSLQYS